MTHLRFFVDHCISNAIMDTLRATGAEVLRLREHLPVQRLCDVAGNWIFSHAIFSATLWHSLGLLCRGHREAPPGGCNERIGDGTPSTARRQYVPSYQNEIARKNKRFPRAKLAR